MDLSYMAEMPIEEFQQRRAKVFAQLPTNSGLIVFSNLERQRTASSNYPFRQDNYFWYLTGFNEPDAILLLKKTEQEQQTILFLRPSDPLMETWNGRRLGVEKAPTTLHLDQAIAIDEVRQQLPQLLNGLGTLYYAEEVQQWGDEIVHQTLSLMRTQQRQGVKAPTTLVCWRELLDEMRLFKSENEIRLMQQAGQISALAHIRAMKQARPQRFEYELASEMLHEFNRFGARWESYPSIIASGENACILHYTENDRLMQDGDLVLIDAGCEFAMYAGDITRTFPVNGKFSPAQREIYQIVLEAEKRAIELLVNGNSIKQANDEVLKIKVAGLVRLGILSGDVDTLIAEKAYTRFYMHSLGHWLGLDVHDVGAYGQDRTRELQPGMVVTVEPGLYIPNAEDIPAAYRGIGVRIEDDLLITEYGNKVLTAAVPKEIDEIEALMAQKD
ncbi:proline aminopeptidase P II [Gallibacterium salpingitidis]|uniref:Xaa-Pro aminopeptidase n=1 Tax=Gallibacterium salpingitidis TaxID=505341 RepID=A0AB36E3Z0_9PAST|nr:Xaa-Pro aminopeptidase [Gallibacterium salpingitidis]OBX06543.1 proline aminopeptidase P II [Gallibacterium salpingitidis]OBX11383.1 proline aminopeptidase P II [Gallibacterium salpingitidis]WKT00007.1 Xaa-Pro aminopeptidase [Gallibacterium salpingitidis]